MDLTAYRGCFLGSVSMHATAYEDAGMSIELTDGPNAVVVLEFKHVVRIAMDDYGDWCGFFDDFEVRELPRDGPWPNEAKHLLHHHNNESAMLWVRLIGPTEIDIVARELIVKPTGAPITVQTRP